MKIKKVKRAKSTDTKNHYVTNAQLLPEVIRAKELGIVTPELSNLIYLIAVRLSHKYNFVGYTYRNDMVALAVLNLSNPANALKFDPARSSNPFTYYTTAIYNSFLQCMADEKKHRNIRDMLLVDAGSNPSFNFMESEKDESYFEHPNSDDPGAYGAGDKAEIDSKWNRYESREPSAIKYFSGDSVDVDEHGNTVIKDGATPIIKKYVKPKEPEVVKKRSPFAKKKVDPVAEESTEIDAIDLIDLTDVEALVGGKPAKKTTTKKTTKKTATKKTATKKTTSSKKAGG